MAQQQNADPNQDILIIVAVTAGICALLYFTIPIWKEFFLTLKMYQFQLLNFFTDWEPISKTAHDLNTRPQYMWSFADVAKLGYFVNYIFVIPFIFLVRYAAKMLDNELFSSLRLHRSLNAVSLADLEIGNVWHFLKPIWGVDLLKQNLHEGAWASARKPHEVALKYGLFHTPYDPETMNWDKTRRYFSMQLGNVFTGENSLSDYHKALLGVFFAYMMRDAKTGEYALMDIACTFDAKKPIKPDYTPGLILFEKYKNNPDVKAMMYRHAYINTMMAGTFETIKKMAVGVLPAHYFIWLKIVDRPLFYALNNEGRKVAWTECAGIINHMKYEIALNKPMAKQFVDEAVKAFQEEARKVIPKH